MNRPNPIVYLIGNPISCLFLLGIAALLIFQWWTHQETTSWLILPVAAFIGYGAMKANTQLRTYKAWRREYDAIAEAGQSSASGARQSTAVNMLIVIALWAGLGYWLVSNATQAQSTKYYGELGLLFLTINAALVLKFIHWLVTRRRRVAVSSSDGYVVTACLPVPNQSPRALDVLPALPHYCRRLLRLDR